MKTAHLKENMTDSKKIEFDENEVMDFRLIVAAEADEQWETLIVAQALDGTTKNFRGGIIPSDISIERTEDGGVSIDGPVSENDLNLIFMCVLSCNDFWQTGGTTETNTMAAVLLDAGWTPQEVCEELACDYDEIKEAMERKQAAIEANV